METLTILIFSTSVSSVTQIDLLRKELDGFGRWSFDLDDEDRVLRMETVISPALVCACLQGHGIRCTLMPY